MVTHDIDEALYLADRIILMTDGPEATVGEICDVPFPRPRRRATVLDHPDYHPCRRACSTSSSTTPTRPARPRSTMSCVPAG